ncbi:MAG TPA: hypothetical protein VNE39_08440 [Planctomycetota bacterium]|nr:hypothetical protein [Planctomycetota bacterium]
MFRRVMMLALLVGLVGLAFTQVAMADDTPKSTITGMGKALVTDAKDPSVANATVTVTAADGSQVAYDVYGWAGIIVAKQGDGKKVEVTGVVGEKDGKKTITGRSVDVKIIIVEER